MGEVRNLLKTWATAVESWSNQISREESQEATSEFQKPSSSKWDQVHNLSCENEFYLHENEKSFPYQRLIA